MEGLSKFVDGEHYFDTLDNDVLFEFRYDFPGWPQVTRGRANLVALYLGYGNNIRLDRGDSLIVHPSENGRVMTLEYEVHGKVLATDTPTTTGLSRSPRLRIARSCAGLHGFARRMEGVERGHLTARSRFNRRSASGRIMSALGQQRTKSHVCVRSALLPKADSQQTSWEVRSGPIPHSCTAEKQRRGTLAMAVGVTSFWGAS